MENTLIIIDDANLIEPLVQTYSNQQSRMLALNIDSEYALKTKYPNLYISRQELLQDISYETFHYNIKEEVFKNIEQSEFSFFKTHIYNISTLLITVKKLSYLADGILSMFHEVLLPERPFLAFQQTIAFQKPKQNFPIAFLKYKLSQSESHHIDTYPTQNNTIPSNKKGILHKINREFPLTRFSNFILGAIKSVLLTHGVIKSKYLWIGTAMEYQRAQEQFQELYPNHHLIPILLLTVRQRLNPAHFFLPLSTVFSLIEVREVKN